MAKTSNGGPSPNLPKIRGGNFRGTGSGAFCEAILNELSLFTGAGGGVLGSKILGHRIIGYVENNKYCQKIIRQRMADGILDVAPQFGNIRKFISEGYAKTYSGLADIVTG